MNKKKMIVGGVAAVLAVGLIVLATRPKEEEVFALRTAVLERQDLQNTVDVTGTVQSVTEVEVYSTLSYPVKHVPVEVGQTIEEGALLCELDSSSLEQEIAVKQASIGTSSRSAQLSLEQAQANLVRAEENLSEDHEDAVLEAEIAVENAERALRQAQFNTNTARDTLEDARRENRRADDDEEPYSTSSINSFRNSLNAALIAEEDAAAALDQARDKLARVQGEVSSLDSYRDQVDTAQLATDLSAEYISLQMLQQNLADCIITAPVSGTITAIYANEGGSGSGLLFVIEDIDNLKVATQIKEYDINTVKIGDPVLIKADGAAGDVYDGVLSKVAPTTVKGAVNNTTGEKESTNLAEFEAEVRVSSTDSRLLIGMSTRMNIIVEEKLGVYAVSYEMLGYNEEGEPVLFTAEPDGEGGWIARAIPVTVGMETDFYVEVSGAGLEEGMLLIAEADYLSDGAPVALDIGPSEAAASPTADAALPDEDATDAPEGE